MFHGNFPALIITLSSTAEPRNETGICLMQADEWDSGNLSTSIKNVETEEKSSRRINKKRINILNIN